MTKAWRGGWLGVGVCLAAWRLPCPAQTTDFDSVAAAASQARSQGDMNSAFQLYTKGVALNPGWGEGWWALGTMQYGADHYAEARDALSHLIELTPDATAALALRGLCEFETGQYQESLQDLQRGIALGAANQPRNAQIVLYHEALDLTRLGRFEEAIGKYIPFVKQTPVNPDLEMAVGLAGLRMPLLPKDVDSTQAELITMVGHAGILVMQGDAAGSRQAFQAVFSRYPTTPNIHYFYGYLLFALHLDDAIPQFQQEVLIAPQSGFAHAMLAWVMESEGDYAGALPDAEKAAADDPSLALGQLVDARALLEKGNVAAAMPHLQTVLNQEPGNLEAHLALAKAYAKLGREDDARQERAVCMKIADEEAAPHANP